MRASIRLGILGAARAAPAAVIAPAIHLADVTIAAVASRSRQDAQAFASRYAIGQAYGGYAALLDDESIDAVYVALPPALHAEWTMRALARGKHVLCEKPLATDARTAEEMAAAARSAGRVLQEGVHTRFSRVLRRMRDVVRGGTLGTVRHVAATFRHPNIPMRPGDFRLQFALGGGAALDLGGYAVSGLREVAGEEPLVRDAICDCVAPDVDGWMKATLAFPSGATGSVECGFRGTFEPKFGVDVDCARGTVRMVPGGLSMIRDGQIAHEAIDAGSTYQLQLEAFVRQIRGEPSDAPPPGDAVATARVLDAIYEASGLTARGAPRPA